MPVVHAIAARLRSDAEASAVDDATEAALALEAAPGVEGARVGRSSTHLITAVWLASPAALEPFAASAPHMTFVMRGLAPVVQGMWSVSVATDRPPSTSAVTAAWVFAIPEAEGVFEWQIQRRLASIDAGPGSAWVGPTIEERERYRAGGVVLLTDDERAPFEAALVTSAAEVPDLEAVLAPVTESRSETGASS